MKKNGLNNLKKNKMKKQVGAPPKIKGEKKMLRISRVVPSAQFEPLSKEINELINKAQNQALDKCVNENLKTTK
jgi:hypothetical protein